MVDNRSWRAFEVRRPEGGDVDRATTGWHGALRFGAEDFAFDVVTGTTLVGIPWGYDETKITIQVPTSVPTRGEMVLVRGAFGYPTTPLDGVPVFYVPDGQAQIAAQYNQQVTDTPVTGGYRYYYTLFIKVTDQPYPQPATWMVGAVVDVLVPRMYAHATKLFESVPPFYQSLDDQQAADGRHGPLRKFIQVIGYDADYNRTLLDGVLNVYNPDLAPLEFVQQLGANLGLTSESALGGARFRSLVGRLWDLESARGTAPGLQAFIYAASNYLTIVESGVNQLLTPDDTEFVNGVGHWQVYSNPHVIDMTDSVGGTHPPAGIDYSQVALRPYAGTDLLPPQNYGRGVLEIIELVTTITTGMYGAPGTLDGPQTPHTLAELLAQAPPITPKTVPNYWTATATPWWAGDYYPLPDGTKAYWNGTTWAAGAAPNSGASVRGALQYLVTGSPASTFPLGALPPANFAALNFGGPSISNVHPPVAWQAGEYVLLQDGTTWHLEYQTVGGHPGLFWVAGVATLTIPATQGALGPISGYNPKWQVSDGSPAIAPPDFATLSVSTVILGKAQSGGDRPWYNNQSFERLYCYDSTRVSWLGSAFAWPSAGTGGTVVGWPINVSAHPWDTGDAFVDSPRAAGATATNVMFTVNPTGSGGGVTTRSPLAVGWTPLAWPTANAVSGVAWANVAGNKVTWSPASSVDVRFHAQVVVESPVGGATVLALFRNGVEHSRVTHDGGSSHPLHHVCTLAAVSTDVFEYRVYTPITTNLFVTGSGALPQNTYPFWRIIPTPAITATSGAWGVQAAGRYNISAYLSPGIASEGASWFVLRNGTIILSGFLNADDNELCHLQGFVDLAVNDRIFMVVSPTYDPGTPQQITLQGSSSPRLTICRWKVL